MRKCIVGGLVFATILALGMDKVAADDRRFVAHLSGDEEVPSSDSLAQGQALFNLNETGTQLRYQLIVANIEDVTQAHIHVAPRGQNGPVVAFLFGFISEGVTENGVLAVNTLTSANLVGPLVGQPLSALIDELRSGNTYVNVHTVDNPPGEIRGQIR